MKIFIIGGTGFISKKIVEILLQRGHDITIFTRGRSSNPFSTIKKITQMTGDRNRETELKSAVSDNNFDVVLDMTAYQPGQSESAVKVFKGRTGRFIHCSTVSVYMVSNDIHCPITEDQDTGRVMDNFPRNPFGMDYGIDKRKCEDVLWGEHNPGLFPVTVLRPVFVCGPEDRTARDYFWIQRILDGKPLLIPGSGDCAFQQVYVDDTARAFCDVMETEITIGEAYNIASEEFYSLNEYINLISSILNKNPELIHIDQEVFDSLDISYYPGADVFPFNTRRTAIFSLEKIKKHIGYRSTPFMEWMPATIEWYRNNVKNSYGYGRRNEELIIADKWMRGLCQLKDISKKKLDE